MAFKGTPTVLEDANRADVGPPPSASWTTRVGTGHKVVSNTLRGNTTGAAHGSHWATNLAADHYAGIRIVASQGTGNDVAVDLRIQDLGSGGDYLRVRHWRRAADDDVQVSVILNGSNTLTRTGPLMTRDFALNDVLLAEAIDDQLLVYRQPAAGGDAILLGTVLIPTTIGDTASTVGIFNWQSTTSAPTLDDFMGGDSNGHDFPIVVAGSMAAAEATTVSPTLPPHLENDILIVAAQANVAADLTISAGWTLLYAVNNATMSYAMWWRRVGASETVSNPTVTQTAAGSSTNSVAAVPYRARGCKTSGNPFYSGDGELETAPFSRTTLDTYALSSLSTANTTQLTVWFVEGSGAWATTAGAGAPPVGADLGIVHDATTTSGADHRQTAIVREMPTAGAAYASQTVGVLAASSPTARFTIALIPQPSTIETTGVVTSVAELTAVSNPSVAFSGALASVAVPTAVNGTEDRTPIASFGGITSISDLNAISTLVEQIGDATSRAVITGVSSSPTVVATTGTITSVAAPAGTPGSFTAILSFGGIASIALPAGSFALTAPVATTGAVVSLAQLAGLNAVTVPVVTTGQAVSTAIITGSSGDIADLIESLLGYLLQVEIEKLAALDAAVLAGDEDAIDLAASELGYIRRAVRECRRALSLAGLEV